MVRVSHPRIGKGPDLRTDSVLPNTGRWTPVGSGLVDGPDASFALTRWSHSHRTSSPATMPWCR
jgi:hypothetical protein